VRLEVEAWYVCVRTRACLLATVHWRCYCYWLHVAGTGTY